MVLCTVLTRDRENVAHSEGKLGRVTTSVNTVNTFPGSDCHSSPANNAC